MRGLRFQPVQQAAVFPVRLAILDPDFMTHMDGGSTERNLQPAWNDLIVDIFKDHLRGFFQTGRRVFGQRTDIGIKTFRGQNVAVRDVAEPESGPQAVVFKNNDGVMVRLRCGCHCQDRAALMGRVGIMRHLSDHHTARGGFARAGAFRNFNKTAGRSLKANRSFNTGQFQRIGIEAANVIAHF